MALSQLDPGQVLQNSSDDANGALRVTIAGSSSGGTPAQVATVNTLIKVPYDYIALTYIASGNGAGSIGTAQYYSGGSGGTLVGTLTLSYDSNNNLISVALS